MKIIRVLILSILLLNVVALAHDYIPGQKQSFPILLRGGDLHTVSHGLMPKTDLLFENGRITEIGTNFTSPPGTEIIDITGKQVYPGLIAPNTALGLAEIGQVRATLDHREIGKINPDVQSHIAFNPDSEIIPTIRSNGITHALIVPQGQLVNGRSSLLNLDSWTKEDGMEKLNVGLHITWPSYRIRTSWEETRTAEEQKRENAENLSSLKKIFTDAHTYFLQKKNNLSLPIDSKFEAMLGLFDRTLPLFAHANDARQIEGAVKLAQDFDLKLVIVGGNEAWKLTDLLASLDIPVILSKTQRYPSHSDFSYDMSYRIPSLLAEAGVKFCFSYGGTTGIRNLPFQASQAVAFGLSNDQALKSLTLTTAQILGVEANLGSLEVGKKASLIVSSGDILEHQFNRIELEFIDGRAVDLNNKHKELYQKYKLKQAD